MRKNRGRQFINLFRGLKFVSLLAREKDAGILLSATACCKSCNLLSLVAMDQRRLKNKSTFDVDVGMLMSENMILVHNKQQGPKFHYESY